MPSGNRIEITINQGTRKMAAALKFSLNGTEYEAQGLRHIKKSYNKIAKEILLWMEIKRRAEEEAQFKGMTANCMSDLEHIMPQTWKDYWPITKPAVVDPESGNAVAAPEEATQLRKDAVYEIGNMSLLNTRWNRQVQNRDIEIKIKGDGAGIPGIEIDKIDVRYTRDVLNEIVANGYLWNEKTIRDRTNKLSDQFLLMW